MKDQTHYYKIVRRLASPLREGTGMYSMYAQGGLRKRYFEGRWNFARLKYLLKGYGFLVFSDRRSALQTMENSESFHILEVWEVQILGELALPTKRLDIGWNFDSVTEEALQMLLKHKYGHVQYRDGWPGHTAMCAGVKLVRQISREDFS